MKRTVLVVIVILIAYLTIPWHVAAGTNPEGFKGNVLLVYDERQPMLIDADYVSAMTNLLGHFDFKIVTLQVESYSAGDINHYDYVIYMGNITKELPSIFLDEVSSTSIPVMWIDANIDQVIAHRPSLGWAVKSSSFSLTQILYRDRIVSNGRTQLMNCLRVDSTTKVWAWALSGHSRNPFVISKDSFWYVARLDFWRGHLPVVADLLHDFLNIEHVTGQRAFIRIEDVHPKRDPSQIIAIADYLYQEHVPFMLAVIPVYVNPQSGETVSLSQAPEMAEALRYAVNKGGSIVLHGYTHQFGDSETGIGFEFWDGERDQPLAVNSASYVRDRLDRGVDELLKAGLRPLAFEPPHYAMSSRGYFGAAHQFSTIVGAVQLGDQTRKINQTFPYIIDHDNYGFKIIPENLGYLDPSVADPLRLPLARAERLKVVRDATVGVFFHPFVDIGNLRSLIEGLRKLDYDFYDLKQDVHWVSTRGASYQVGQPTPSEPTLPSLATKPSLFHQLGITVVCLFLAVWIVWTMLQDIGGQPMRM